MMIQGSDSKVQFTTPASTPRVRVDYCFARAGVGGGRVGVEGVRVLGEAEGGSVLSDHLALIVDLTFR